MLAEARCQARGVSVYSTRTGRSAQLSRGSAGLVGGGTFADGVGGRHGVVVGHALPGRRVGVTRDVADTDEECLDTGSSGAVDAVASNRTTTVRSRSRPGERDAFGGARCGVQLRGAGDLRRCGNS